MPGISLALTLARNALSISSLWASSLRGAAMAAKGAAGIILADARAAVRNSASRRVIDPVIGVLQMRRRLARPRENGQCCQSSWPMHECYHQALPPINVLSHVRFGATRRAADTPGAGPKFIDVTSEIRTAGSIRYST